MQIEEIEAKLQPVMDVPFIITKRPDAKFGETVVLLAEIKHDGIDTLEGNEILEKIKAACKARLSKYEQPRVFIVLDRLPMTETGKPARAEAMKIAAAYYGNL